MQLNTADQAIDMTQGDFYEKVELLHGQLCNKPFSFLFKFTLLSVVLQR